MWRVGRSRYRFVVSNPDHLSHGIARAQLDGADVDPAAIPLVDDGAEHQVNVLLGSESTMLRTAAAGSRRTSRAEGMNSGARVRWPAGLPELGDRIQLPDGGLIVDTAEYQADDKQQRCPGAPVGKRRIRSVPQLDIVDELGHRSAEIVLGDECRSRQRLDVIGVHGWKQLADQRQRSHLAAAGLGAAGGIARDHTGRTAAAEIAGVFRVLIDRPDAGQADAVRVHEPAETLPVRAPSEIGAGIEYSLAVALELTWQAEGSQPADDGRAR